MTGKINVQQLDVLTFPLYGARLIEASAGTGKTFTIASLFIRLLLGHGDKNSHKTPLTVDQILVVTFTEAATAELRSRICARILEVRLAFLKNSSDDPFIKQLLVQVEDKQAALRLLRSAELQMDEAAIFTIHGFCQRMLKQNAFESDSLFEQTLLQDETKLKQQACNDFWRTFFYGLSAPLTQLVFEYWKTPQALKQALDSWISRGDVTFVPNITDFDFQKKYQQSLKKIQSLKKNWIKDQADYADIINHSDVSKRSYTKKNLANWLTQISKWATQSSHLLSLHDKLEKFSQKVLDEKTSKGAVPRHGIFIEIEQLLAEDLSIKNILLIKATKWVKNYLTINKEQRMLLGFDDLLIRLDVALQKSIDDQLGRQIKANYPIALIDEFQDTDPVQYRLFQKIYLGGESLAPRASGIFMIGDPKQAIYSFRGADIFTYITARRNVTAHYSLGFNYRSSKQMINAVNAFFANSNSPFIYNDDIPFIKVQAPDLAKKELVTNNLDDPKQTALQFILALGGENIQGFKDSMAQACASEIKKLLLLANDGEAYLQSKGNRQSLCAHNIAVLVRTGKEAQLVRNALFTENINSVYLSLKESVYETAIAQDLLYLLKACFTPENESYLRSAIACKVYGLTVIEIDELLSDTRLWELKLAEFAAYKVIWHKQGISAMLHRIFYEQGISRTLLKSKQGERALTDLLHLGELLQKNSVEYDGEFALLRWFADQIQVNADDSGEQKQRLESESDLVQVSTLHKSKGLEYDIVFMPFTGIYQKPRDCLYHAVSNNELVYDLDCDKAHMSLVEKEQLAEDLRLLYVGITRSVYRCYIGIGAYKTGRAKVSGLVKSALGHIILKGDISLQAGQSAALNSKLTRLCERCPDISIRALPKYDETLYSPLKDNIKLVPPLVFTGYIEQNWWINSYSSLSKFHLSAPIVLIEKEPTTDVCVIDINPQKTPFNFPRGAKHGLFLHELFEIIDFSHANKESLQEMLHERLNVALYDEAQAWAPVMALWIEQILDHTLLANNRLALRRLCKKQSKIEMKFVIDMKPVHARSVNQLIAKYDPLSKNAGIFTFSCVQGFLTGFIDLIFEFEGKYYVLDHKSNYLGDSLEDYNQENIEAAMIEHRYDFQYQLYTLALHRLLKSRLADYNYDTHIGGILYTFLRGMQGDDKYGVYFHKPDFALIDGLDALFKGQTL